MRPAEEGDRGGGLKASGEPAVPDRYERLARGCLVGLVTAVPILFTQSTLNMFDLPKFSLLCFGAALGFGLFELSRRGNAARSPWSPVLVLAALVFALTAISAFASPYKTIAILGLYNRYGGLVSQLAFFLVFLLVIRLGSGGSVGVVEAVARGLGVAAAVVSGYTLIQAAGLDWFRWESLDEARFNEAFGNLGNPNFTGAFLGIALPVCIYRALTAPSRAGRGAWIAVAGLACIAIFETQTRGGIVAAGAALATVALGSGNQLRALWKGARGLARAVAITVVAAGVLVALPRVIGTFSESAPPLELLHSGSFKDRINYWRSAVEVISDHPLFGSGPNTFYLAYLPYRSVLPPDQRDFLTIDTPHNIFLERAAASGLPALALYLALLGTVLALAWKRARSERGRERLRLVAFGALVVGYVAQGIFSLDVPGLAFVGVVGLASLAALTELARRERSTAFRGRRWRKARSAIVVVAVAVLGVIAIRTFAADAKGRLAIESTNEDAALQHADEAIALNPFEGEYQFLKARLLTRRALASAGDVEAALADLRSADRAFRRALGLRPLHALWTRQFAQSKTLVANATNDVSLFASAEEIWSELEEFDPLNYLAWFERSENFRQWARATGDPSVRRRQVDALERSIALNRKQDRAWVRLSAAYHALGETERSDAVLVEYFGEVLSAEEMDEVVQAVPPNLATPLGSLPFRPWVLGWAVLTLGLAGLLSKIDLSRAFGVETDTRSVGAPKDSSDGRPFNILLAVGVVAIAMAAPYIGPLFGLRPSSGDIQELLAHLGGGALILAVALGWRSRAGRPYFLLLGLAGLLMTVLHWGSPVVGAGHPAWSRALAHLAPGVIALAWASGGWLMSRTRSSA